MKRIVLLFTVAAMMATMSLAMGAGPALAQEDDFDPFTIFAEEEEADVEVIVCEGDDDWEQVDNVVVICEDDEDDDDDDDDGLIDALFDRHDDDDDDDHHWWSD